MIGFQGERPADRGKRVQEHKKEFQESELHAGALFKQSDLALPTGG